jgi:hypothetical protein
MPRLSIKFAKRDRRNPVIIHVLRPIHIAELPIETDLIEEKLHPRAHRPRVLPFLRQMSARHVSHQHVPRHGDRMIATTSIPHTPRTIRLLLRRQPPQCALDHLLRSAIDHHRISSSRHRRLSLYRRLRRLRENNIRKRQIRDQKEPGHCNHDTPLPRIAKL